MKVLATCFPTARVVTTSLLGDGRMAHFDHRRIDLLAGQRIDLVRLPDTSAMGRRHDRT